MSDTPNNPVMTQPKRNISQTARKGIMQVMREMAGMVQGQNQGRRNGKHHGRNPGAFGKQRK